VVHEATLAATTIIVLIKAEHADKVNDIESESLTLGLMGKIANKGAVKISFKLGI